MQSKDLVTLTLCSNATGSHKLPIAMIEKAVQTMCFVGASNLSSLPYFSQKLALADARVFKRWFQDLFLPSIRT